MDSASHWISLQNTGSHGNLNLIHKSPVPIQSNLIPSLGQAGQGHLLSTPNTAITSSLNILVKQCMSMTGFGFDDAGKCSLCVKQFLWKQFTGKNFSGVWMKWLWTFNNTTLRSKHKCSGRMCSCKCRHSISRNTERGSVCLSVCVCPRMCKCVSVCV